MCQINARVTGATSAVNLALCATFAADILS